MIKLKRVYEAAEKSDGFRILVDRLWPRGISKEKGKIDVWMKEIAPSNELRKSFHHDIDKWEEFEKKYRKELEEKKELVEELRGLIQKHTTVTFLFASKNTQQNNATVLKAVIDR